MTGLLNSILLFIAIRIFFYPNNFKQYLLMIGIIALPFKVDVNYFQVGGIGSSTAITFNLIDVIFIILYILSKSKSYPFKHILNKISVPFMLYITTCILSMINNSWMLMSIFQIIVLIQVYFFIYTLFISLNNESDIKSAISATTFSLILQGVLSLLQFTTGSPWRVFATGEYAYDFMVVGESFFRVTGSLGQPNGFAKYIVPHIVLNVCLLMNNNNNNNKKIMRLTGIILSSIAVVLSFSRGGWIAYSISIILILLNGIRKNNIEFKKFTKGVLLALVLIVIFWNYIQTRVTSDDHNAAESRIPLMQIAINMIKDNVVTGVGINNYYDVIHSYTKTPDLQNIYLYIVHNHYLYVLAETGVIGFLAFLWIYLRCFSIALQCEGIKNNSFYSSIGTGTKYALLAIAVHMFVEPYGSYQFWANQLYFPILCLSCLRVQRYLPLDNFISVENTNKQKVSFLNS